MLCILLYFFYLVNESQKVSTMMEILNLGFTNITIYMIICQNPIDQYEVLLVFHMLYRPTVVYIRLEDKFYRLVSSTREFGGAILCL